jgi:uncharacterized protein
LEMILRQNTTNRLAHLLAHFPAVLIIGARQVGKSTLVERLSGLPVETWVFDPLEDIGGARQEPSLFVQNLKFPVFLDEIQYSPQILPALKRRLDQEGAKGLVIMSGSQQFEMMRGVAESLAGRVAIMELPPLSWSEIQKVAEPGAGIRHWITQQNAPVAHTPKPQQTLWHAIFRGGMPGVLDMPDDLLRPYFQSYLKTYIDRDLLPIARIRQLEEFHRFFMLLAYSSAQEHNPAHFARELGIDHGTARDWLDICRSTFQWMQLPAFGNNLNKRVTTKPKGIFADSGFLCALAQIPSAQALAGHPMSGQLFETWVVQEIARVLRFSSIEPDFYHYRTYDGSEVDLLLSWNGIIYPVEIKLTAKPSKQDTRGMGSLRERFPDKQIAKGLLICSVERPYWIKEDCFALPWWGI